MNCSLNLKTTVVKIKFQSYLAVTTSVISQPAKQDFFGKEGQNYSPSYSHLYFQLQKVTQIPINKSSEHHPVNYMFDCRYNLLFLKCESVQKQNFILSSWSAE